MKYKALYLIISLAVIVPGVYSLLSFGLKLGIDFTGGTSLELAALVDGQESTASAYVKPVKDYFDRNKIEYEKVEASAKRLVVRMKEIDEGQKNDLLKKISQEVIPVSEKRFESLGPLLGGELIYKTLVGVVLAAVLIAFYIVYQFKGGIFGLCAILATLHDSLVILGTFSLLGRFFGVEVDTLFVTAVLTVLSFSVHDTIVVYDRIREKMGILEASSSNLTLPNFEEVIDRAINETLVRSLNNSLTVIFMLVALFVLGGTSMKWFVLALLVGTVSGTYSSPFVAAPLLVVFKKLNKKLKKNESP